MDFKRYKAIRDAHKVKNDGSPFDQTEGVPVMRSGTNTLDINPQDLGTISGSNAASMLPSYADIAPEKEEVEKVDTEGPTDEEIERANREYKEKGTKQVEDIDFTNREY